MSKSKMQHPVPDSFLLQFGDMMASFALLESGIKMFAGSLIGQPQPLGQIITAELSFKGCRNLACSLYLHRYGEDKDYKTFKSLIQKSGKIEEERNKITHSIWGAGKTIDTITRIKATAKEKYGLQFQAKDLNIKELSAFVDEIKILAGEIQNFTIHKIYNIKIGDKLDK